MSNKNAYIGMDVERLFKNSVRNNSIVLNTLKDHFSINGEFATSYKTGTDSGKSDVILKFSDGTTLSANIKAFKAGFNQVARASMSTFCERFEIPGLRPVFEEGALRVASKSGRFILESDETLVKTGLEPIAKRIVHRSIAGNENPELLVLFDRGASKMIIYDMAALLEDLDYEVTFSGRGVIKIGKYFSIQRKGGNGVHSIHIPKTSLEHPGNGLQVKLDIRRFVTEVPPITSYSPKLASAPSMKYNCT
jgi:hypothetical protein